MITQQIPAREYTELEVTIGVAYAIQYRGAGKCYIRVGDAQDPKFKEGFCLETNDILRIKPNELVYAYSTTPAAFTIEEVA